MAKKRWLLISAAATLVALGLGVAVALVDPLTLLGALAAVAILVAFTRSAGRLAFVIAGGLVVLQSESTNLKLAYLVGTAVCAVAAAARLPRAMRERPEFKAFTPILWGSLAVLTLCAINLPVALGNGVGLLDWFRQVLPYLLLAILPVIGLDCAIDSSQRWVRGFIVLVGIVACVAFMTDWLDRRGASALPVGRFAFASLPLAAVLLSYSLARLAVRGRLLLWVPLAIIPPLAILLTGTRSGLALLGGILGAMGSRARMRLRPRTTISASIGLVTGLYLLVPLLGQFVTTDAGFYLGRFSSLSGGLSGLTDDRSLIGRTFQSDVALRVFGDHPFFGEGVGIQHLGVRSLDTPLAPLAYFGALGVLLLGVYVLTWLVAVRRLARDCGPSFAITAARSFLFAMVCYLPLSSVFDDKGLALAVTLLAALLPAVASPADAAPATLPAHVTRTVATANQT
jgi:hypothetical protein